MCAEAARTFCQICRAECGMIVHVEDDRVIRVEGDPEDQWSRGKLCVKGRHAPQILYAQDRLLHPMIRDKKGGAFQRTSWKTAIDFIAEKMERIRERYGPEALVFYRGTTAKVLDDAVLRRLAKLYGTPNVTGTWSICVGPKILAYSNTFGRPPMPWCDLANASYIVLWGTNPPATHMHRYHGINSDILSARRNGARLAVIDPRRTPIAAQADHYLQVRPGTDLALGLAMIRHIIVRDLYDEDFVAAHTHGFDRLVEHVAPYTPHWAQEITDVPAASIERLAEDFARSKPAALERRQGVQHCQNGTQTLRAMAILVAITGNVDVRGGLMLTPYRSLKSLAVPDDLPRPAKSFWRDRYPLVRDASGMLPEVILSGNPYPIGGLIAIEGNPMACFPNTGKTHRALTSLDLLVVQDLFMNETAELADVVLPGCTFLEKGEISAQSLRTDYPVRTRMPVVRPLGQSLPEWKFLSMLGHRLGYEQFFPFTRDEEVIEEVLQRAGWTGHELATPAPNGQTLAKGFTTPSGKIELYSAALEEHGFDPMPTAPLDWPNDDTYPYYLITGARVPQFYHSQHRNIPGLRKAHPEPLAEMSPSLASDLGVGDGDEVKLETKVGAAVYKARVVDGVHPRTVSIPHGWTGAHNANWLVDDLSCDPLAATPPYRDMHCRVERL